MTTIETITISEQTQYHIEVTEDTYEVWNHEMGRRVDSFYTQDEAEQAIESLTETVEEAPVVEQASSIVSTPETPTQSIHDLIIEKQERRPGKPSQAIYELLLREEQEEGPHNDGLLATYIREAHETLEDLVLLINEDRLYKKILSGETVQVQVASTGKAFTIRTTENNATGLPAYDILSPSGKIEKRGIILDKTALRTWMYGLVEV